MQAVQKENSKLQFNSNNDSDEISIKKMGISEKDLNDNKQFCEIEYLSEEENEEYDIIHNPEKFILHVDGEKVE